LAVRAPKSISVSAALAPSDHSEEAALNRLLAVLELLASDPVSVMVGKNAALDADGRIGRRHRSFGIGHIGAALQQVAGTTAGTSGTVGFQAALSSRKFEGFRPPAPRWRFHSWRAGVPDRGGWPRHWPAWCARFPHRRR
jgi:hypothetical protein